MNPYFLAPFLLLLCCSNPNSKDKGESEDRSVQDIAPNQNKKITTFIYHRFGDDRYPSTNIGIADFRAQLDYLKTEQFHIMNFSDAIAYMYDDSPVQKVAVITIDDGFESFYENGLPLLEAHGFPATLFINTETVGGASYMDWAQLKDAGSRGIEIGNHTHSHAFFLDQPEEIRYDQFEAEIAQCQDLIDKHLGIKPKVFAYPYGEFDIKMKNIVKGLGFIAAAAQNSGAIYAGTDPMACPRFPMAAAFADLESFKLKANSLPLKVMGEPADHIITEDYSPELNLTVDQKGLRTDEMQCFIQGSNCDLKMNETSKGEFKLNIKPQKSLQNRRRTLYTLTVQDSINQWHWYSYLWINPKVKE